MDAISLLTQRQSNGHLQAPAPNEQQLDIILTSALRVPDHGNLTPFHIDVFQGKALQKLTQAFVNAAKERNLAEAKQQKAATMATRAPMIIMVSTRYQEHPKVPKSEQLITAGCAVHAMQMAAFAQGLGAIWRTGDFCYFDEVKRLLGVSDNNDIVGFLYLGTESKQLAVKPNKNKQSTITFVNAN